MDISQIFKHTVTGSDAQFLTCTKFDPGSSAVCDSQDHRQIPASQPGVCVCTTKAVQFPMSTAAYKRYKCQNQEVMTLVSMFAPHSDPR